MMHRGGARSIGGNMPKQLQEKVSELLDEFIALVEIISQNRSLPRAVVRSLLSCNLVAVLDKSNLFILTQKNLGGMPSSLFIEALDQQLTSQQALYSATWEFGFEDPFIIVFPNEILQQEKVQRRTALEAIAIAHIDSEYQRILKMTSLIQINPLFGPASYSVNDRLAFVLMPFAEDLTRIYTSLIKPTVEAAGLVCHRADDFKTNKAIIQDIWKAICESRVVIADLTNLNPNVMYELGIAHTVGKETILIYQRRSGESPKFPFDLAHIRRIEYEDNAIGGKKLEHELSETLKSILEPVVLS